MMNMWIECEGNKWVNTRFILTLSYDDLHKTVNITDINNDVSVIYRNPTMQKHDADGIIRCISVLKINTPSLSQGELYSRIERFT
ncbi:MAG: hypothetical protein BWY47_00149 [Bacteroidetes bacterium ADurb.Bin302]|nr:MAG: hypothetical protein BWY47_00149 [Bacteroidetes bacterium ADurb.Bin302]